MVESGDVRLITVLVTDVVDSTPIGERLGPERSKPLFDEVSRLLAHEVERFDGTVAQHTGDGLLAFFGAPLAHGDDAERAVRAAMAMHAALEPFAQEAESAYDVDLRIRVAINTGPAAVPRGDQPLDSLYNALGDTVTVAGRLQSFAEPGGVIVGPLTATELRGMFGLEPLGELVLKGKSQTTPAYLVRGERSESSTVRSSLVGRVTELEALRGVLDDLVDGRGAVVIITGEPGIGKSRLIEEGRRDAPGVQFLEAHGVSYQEAAPYWPVQGMLRGWLGLDLAAPDLQVRLELKTALAQLPDGVADEIYPFIASLLGLRLEPDFAEAIRDVSADSVQQQTFAAFETLLVGELARGPMCLVLDDLHWADEATLALAEHLLPLTDEYPLAVLLSYRSERNHQAWAFGGLARTQYPHRLTEIALTPLDATEVTALAVEAAGARLPESVAALLSQRCGGNPFFVEQAVLDLVEGGALVKVDDHYEATSDLDAATVPVRIQETLQARLDRLDEVDREVITAASVIGRSFGLPLLAELIPDPGLVRSLATLQRLELVHERRRRPNPEYEFRHGLVREVAYASLLAPRRRSLHQQVGETLERWVLEGRSVDAGLLGGHFAQAGDAGRAADYLLRAGDHARSVFAERDAVECYNLAISFLEELGDVERRRQTHFRLALSHFLAADFVEANEQFALGFALPEPEPVRVSATETLRLPMRLHTESVTPGYGNSDGSWQLTSWVFRGLFRTDRDASVVPDLAAGLAVSEDGLRIDAAVKPGYTWEDGADVVAADFVHAWRGGRELGLETGHLFDEVTSVMETSTYEFAVALARPLPHLLHLLSQPPSFPRPHHRADQPHRDGPGSGAVGNGPYQLRTWTATSIEFEANDRWPGNRGNVGEVLVDTTAFSLIARDAYPNYDLVADPTEYALAAQPGDTYVRAGMPQTAAVAFLAESGPWADTMVRRAIAMALDPDQLEWDQFGTPAHGGYLPPSLLGHSHDGGIPYDPAESARLLAAAGYPGATGLPPLRLAVYREWATTSGMFDKLTGLWRAVGVDLELQRVGDDYDFLDGLRAAGADAWTPGWIADFPDPEGMLGSLLAVYPVLAPPGSRPAELLVRARATTSRPRRIELYRELDRVLVQDEVRLIPFGYGNSSHLVRSRVHGFWATPLRSADPDELTLDAR
jgi:class 3 adenylate cyclase/ABC-type transport system substrate-binding protein